MRVRVTLSHEMPLARVRVICNATQGLSLNSPVLSIDPTQSSDVIVKQLAQKALAESGMDINELLSSQIDISKLVAGQLDLTKLPLCNLSLTEKNVSGLNLDSLNDLVDEYNMSFTNSFTSDLPVTNMKPEEIEKLICFLKTPPSFSAQNYLPYLIKAQRQTTLIQLSQGLLNVGDLGDMLKRNNIVLDSNRTEEYTDSTGLAEFQLRFIAGLPGNYSIAFQSGSVISKASAPIILTNPIKYVNFLNNMAQTIVYPFSTDDNNHIIPNYINFTMSPILRLRQKDGTNYTGDIHNIQMHLLLSKDVITTSKVLNTSQDDNSWVDIMNVKTLAEDNSDPFSKLSKYHKNYFIEKMWLTMTTGVNVLSYFNTPQDLSRFNYDGYNLTEGLLYINVNSFLKSNK